MIKGAQFSGVLGPDLVLYGKHDLPVIPLEGYEVILGRTMVTNGEPRHQLGVRHRGSSTATNSGTQQSANDPVGVG